MSRVAMLAFVVAAGLMGGLVGGGRPTVLRADEGVTSVGAVIIGNPMAGKTDTTLWLTKGGSVYRCYKVNDDPRDMAKPAFECAKYVLEFK